MKTYLQSGDIITVTAPADVLSGGAVLVGALFGVAMRDALSGAEVDIATKGVFTLPKVTGTAISEGVRVFWDGSAGKVTTVVTGAYCIGWAIGPGNYASGDTTIKVRLGGPNLIAT